MKIVVLAENTSDNPELETRKGLNLYIEKDSHRILFDMGPDGSFIKMRKNSVLIRSSAASISTNSTEKNSGNLE